MHNTENRWSVISFSITFTSAEQSSHFQLPSISLRPCWRYCPMWPISYFESQMQTTHINASQQEKSEWPPHQLTPSWHGDSLLIKSFVCEGITGFTSLITDWMPLNLAEHTRRHTIVVHVCNVDQMQHDGQAAPQRAGQLPDQTTAGVQHCAWVHTLHMLQQPVASH